MKILEIANFTDTLCKASDPPRLINYPEGSNETRLQSEICRISEYVEQELHHKFPNSTDQPSFFFTGPDTFNWTSFNEKVKTIYGYIDNLINTKYPDYDLTERDKLKDQFVVSWTKNLTARDAWEVRYSQ